MPKRERRRRWLRVGTPVVGGVALGLLARAFLDAAGLRVSVWFVVTLAIAALVATSLGRALVGELETPAVARHGPEVMLRSPPEMFARLERRIAGATRQRRLFVVGLQPLLLDLLRERMRLHHTLDLDAALRDDPDLARRILGDELWHWMTTTTTEGPAPTPQQVQAMLAAIGSL